MAEVMPCDFWGWVTKEHAASALFVGCIHSWSPEVPCKKKADSQRSPRWEEAQARKAMYRGCGWQSQLTSPSSPVTRYVSEKASRWFHPSAVWVRPGDALNTTEQRSLRACALSEFLTHRTSENNKMLAVLHHYIWGSLLFGLLSRKPYDFLLNFCHFVVHFNPESTWESYNWLKGQLPFRSEFLLIQYTP